MASPLDIDFGNLRASGSQPPAQPTPQQAAAPTLRAPTPAPVLDTSRLPQLPPDRAMPAADAATYNASPEGRATARQFAQEKFARAGGGSKYVPPTNPAAAAGAAPTAAPTGAAPKPAMPSTGGLRRAAEGAKGLGKFASTAFQAATAPMMVQQMASFTGAEDQKVIDAAIDREKGQLQRMKDQYGEETLRAAYKSKSPWYHFGGVEHSRPEDLEKWTGEYLKQDAGGGRGFMIPPSGAQRPETVPGVRPFTPSDAGAGRASSGYKDPRVVADPATKPRKDFSGELAGVPQDLPSGLEDGRVYKTTDANGRTVYSGRNVRENAGIVDGQGGLRGYLGGGNPKPATDAQGRRLDGRLPDAPLGAPTAIGAQAAAAGQPPAAQNVVQAGESPSSFGLGGSDAAISQARQAAAARGDFDAVAASYGRGGQPSGMVTGGGGHASLSHGTLAGSNAEKFSRQVARSNAESAIRAGLTSGSARERAQALQAQAELARGDQEDEARRYSTDATTETSRYTSDNSLRGQVYSADSQSDSSRYTADMGLRSAYAKNMPAQAQRQAQATAMQIANGDIPTALKILAQHGYSGEGLIATQGALNSDQTTQQNLSEGARKAAVARFGQFMQAGEDGKPVAGAEGALTNAMESIVPGSTQMREDQLAAPIRFPDGTVMTRQAALTAGLTILKGLNTTKDNAFLQSIGWDPANPRLDQLPDLNGAKLGRVGWAKGKVKGGNVESANYELDLGGGRKLYLPHDQIGENELALLRARGVNVPK